ncbi:hypothetical protein HYN49_10350 [Flavobacterium pallidum]|uniref:Uncharacterized protein n=2 Tax=Flavobacterium pallidum TaxID=2172098 RepID=A0A2S1SIT6_9FLAO|nr:hypothetical protein HYN49_10350 [Flavobacterium pallidum]
MSCSSKENPSNNRMELQKAFTDMKFRQELSRHPKIFLKFWYGMSKEEFHKVVDILVAENVLVKDNDDAVYYKVPHFKPMLKPYFINNTLDQIELSQGNNLYDIYQQKYKLPGLVEKNIVAERYVEENSHYRPLPLYHRNTVKELPVCFNDKSLYSNGVKNFSFSTQSNKQKVLSKSPIVVEKENNVIVIEQSFSRIPLPSVTYSLSLSPEMQQYKSTHAITDEQRQYICTHSKYKITELLSGSVIKITYKSRLAYDRETEAYRQSVKAMNEALKRKNAENALRSEKVMVEI